MRCVVKAQVCRPEFAALVLGQGGIQAVIRSRLPQLLGNREGADSDHHGFRLERYTRQDRREYALCGLQCENPSTYLTVESAGDFTCEPAGGEATDLPALPPEQQGTRGRRIPLFQRPGDRETRIDDHG